MPADASFAARPRRPQPLTLVAVALLHLAAIYALARAFAPQATASVERAVLASFTITVPVQPPPPPPPPPPRAESASGKAGKQGRKAVPRAVVAPVPKVVVKPAPPAPRASATGAANISGARESGRGTGAGAGGAGTGSGGGSGQGGGVATKPVWIGGAINNARDFPIPLGGRQARIGKEVIVRVTVGTDGRAANCSIFRPSGDADADATTCRLVVERLRFRPATDSAGNPVPAPFLWRQRWF